jgi:adenylate kinase
MINIVLFGKPEQKRYSSRILKEKYKLTHISTGDVFRFNLKNDTDLGKQARVYMDAGDLVPDELTTKMLIDEVNKHPDTNGILFDGYPRTLSQAIALDAFMISIDSKVTAT